MLGRPNIKHRFLLDLEFIFESVLSYGLDKVGGHGIL